ncbi:MAG: hypothetical protein ACRCSP_00625, partial [Rhodoglobus sp.]
GWSVDETGLGTDLAAAYPDGRFPAGKSKDFQVEIPADGWYGVSLIGDGHTGHHDTAPPPAVLFRDPTAAADFTHIAGLSLEQIRELYAAEPTAR